MEEIMLSAAGSALPLSLGWCALYFLWGDNETMSEINCFRFYFSGAEIVALRLGLNFFPLGTVLAIEHPQSELKLSLGNCDNCDASH